MTLSLSMRANLRGAVWLRTGLAAAMLLAAPQAHAYLDPGTGSILIQGLIAALVGGLFFLRNTWARIKSFFTRGAPRQEKDSSPPT